MYTSRVPCSARLLVELAQRTVWSTNTKVNKSQITREITSYLAQGGSARMPHGAHCEPSETKDKPFKVLNETEVMQNLQKESKALQNKSRFLSYYSSVLGGIVKDWYLAVIPADDHLVHRGHGVFDTTSVWNGKIYQLDQHLERLMRSATAAEIDYKNAGWTHAKLRQAILDTVRAGGKPNQAVRYWLSVGRGDFGISSRGCSKAHFYCVCESESQLPKEVYEQGVPLVTSSVPMKPGKFATAKTTNYLPNALMVIEAEKLGAYQGVWITDEGFVAELATNNIGFSFEKDNLVVPPFDRALRGISVTRMLELCSSKLGVKAEVREVSLTEAKQATEVLVFGGNISAIPAVRWDGENIGDGVVGPLAKKLRAAQLRDHQDAWGDSGHLEVVEGL